MSEFIDEWREKNVEHDKSYRKVHRKEEVKRVTGKDDTSCKYCYPRRMEEREITKYPE